MSAPYNATEDSIVMDGWGHKKSDVEIAGMLAAAGYVRTVESVRKHRRMTLHLHKPLGRLPARPAAPPLPSDRLFHGDAKFTLALLRERRAGSERVTLGIQTAPSTSRFARSNHPPGFVPGASNIV